MKRRMWAAALAAAAVGVTAGPASAADAPHVVVSIAPIHSLVAGVMSGVGAPVVIVRGYGSPHAYQMRPSEARSIADADIVFWVGRPLETFLERPLASLAGTTRVVALLDAPGIERLAQRRGGAWEHDGGDHEVLHHEAGDGARSDPHIWLLPANAKRIVAIAVAELEAIDADNAAAYAANGARMVARIDRLEHELARMLEPVRDVAFVVFHDAYQYLEWGFGLRAVGAVTVTPDRPPSAHRVRELRERIMALGARCLFEEPQFEPALVETLAAGTGIVRGVLDPLGAALPPGPDAWFEMMTANAAALAECLSAR